MSPSQAGSSQSSSWRIFGSARDLFPFSSKSKIGRKRAKFFFYYYFRLCSYIIVFNFLKHLLSYINSYKWSYNWLELVIIMILVENWEFYCSFKLGLKKNSARFQLENWSAPARLGSARNLHSSGSLEPENSSSNSSNNQLCNKIKVHRTNKIATI